jgi:hypothetical protein
MGRDSGMRKLVIVLSCVLFLCLVLVFVVPRFSGWFGNLRHAGNGTRLLSEKELARVKWLEFSPTKYQRERELVIRKENVIHEDLRERGRKIYIALSDLNDDGVQEALAYLDLGRYCGLEGCRMNIYRMKGQRLTSLFYSEWEHGFIVDIDIGEGGRQKRVGILPNKTRGWHDIVGYGNEIAWTWGGENYDYKGTRAPY